MAVRVAECFFKTRWRNLERRKKKKGRRRKKRGNSKSDVCGDWEARERKMAFSEACTRLWVCLGDCGCRCGWLWPLVCPRSAHFTRGLLKTAVFPRNQSSSPNILPKDEEHGCNTHARAHTVQNKQTGSTWLLWCSQASGTNLTKW